MGDPSVSRTSRMRGRLRSPLAAVEEKDHSSENRLSLGRRTWVDSEGTGPERVHQRLLQPLDPRRGWGIPSQVLAELGLGKGGGESTLSGDERLDYARI